MPRTSFEPLSSWCLVLQKSQLLPLDRFSMSSSRFVEAFKYTNVHVIVWRRETWILTEWLQVCSPGVGHVKDFIWIPSKEFIVRQRNQGCLWWCSFGWSIHDEGIRQVIHCKGFPCLSILCPTIHVWGCQGCSQGWKGSGISHCSVWRVSSHCQYISYLTSFYDAMCVPHSNFLAVLVCLCQLLLVSVAYLSTFEDNLSASSSLLFSRFSCCLSSCVVYEEGWMDDRKKKLKKKKPRNDDARRRMRK